MDWAERTIRALFVWFSFKAILTTLRMEGAVAMQNVLGVVLNAVILGKSLFAALSNLPPLS